LAKEFKYFHVFCAKSPPSKKEATIFVPSSSAAPAMGIKNFVGVKRGVDHLADATFAETSARRAQTR
jgi:hypothetical protein